MDSDVDLAADPKPLLGHGVLASTGSSVTGSPSLKARLNTILERASVLDAETDAELGFDRLRQTLESVIENDGDIETWTKYGEVVVGGGALSATLAETYRRDTTSSVREHLDESLTSAVDRNDTAATEALETAIETLEQITRRAERTERLVRLVERLTFSDPADNPEGFIDTLKNRIRPEADLEAVEDPLTNAADGMWEYDDLFAFSPIEFEKLIARLWSEGNNAAQATKGQGDKGIDVIVREDGQLVLIQVKQFGPSNPVGIGPVQRTAGLLSEFDAARVLLVTSSDFTEPAKESAARTDDLTLVYESRLVELLSMSSLAPPVGWTVPASESI